MRKHKYIDKIYLQSYINGLVEYASSNDMHEEMCKNQTKWNNKFSAITEEIRCIKRIILSAPDTQEQIKVNLKTLTTQTWKKN